MAITNDNNNFAPFLFQSLSEFTGDCFGPRHFSSGAALPQKNTSVQNNPLRFHTMTSKKTKTLASQPATGHSLSFIITLVVTTLGRGLFVGLAAESYSRIWLPYLSNIHAGLIKVVSEKNIYIQYSISNCGKRKQSTATDLRWPKHNFPVCKKIFKWYRSMVRCKSYGPCVKSSSETELRLIFLQYCDLTPLITVEDRQSLSSAKLAWTAVSSPTAKISVYQWLPLLQTPCKESE